MMPKNTLKKVLILLLTLLISCSTILATPTPPIEKTGPQMLSEVIESLNLENESLFNKVILCTNWIDDNIRYDSEGLANGHAVRSTYGALKKRVAVCEGYAYLFRDFMIEMGVPCIIFFDDEMNHAYNMVLMNDYKWYLVEPQTSLGISRDGSSYTLNDDFLVGTEDFKNYTIYDGPSPYSPFAQLANQNYLSYPVAKTALRHDPDPTQKTFVSKSSLKVTTPEMTINAAKCPSTIELPIQVENLDRKGIASYIPDNYNIITWEDKASLATPTSNFIEIHSTYTGSPTITYPIEFYVKGALSTLASPVTLKLTVTYPNVPTELSQFLWSNSFKKGKAVTLKVENASLDDFNIIFEPNQNIVAYNPTTKVLTAKNWGSTTIKLQSKTNENYILNVQVYVSK